MRENPAVLDYYAVGREQRERDASPESAIFAAMDSDVYALGYNDGLTHDQPRDEAAEYLNGFAAGWLKRHGSHTGRMVETRIVGGAAKRRYQRLACDLEFRT